jgi:hypothetical protein
MQITPRKPARAPTVAQAKALKAYAKRTNASDTSAADTIDKLMKGTLA